MIGRRSLRPPKPVEPHLNVWVEIASVWRRAGTLHLQEDADEFFAAFTYAPSYLEQGLRGQTFPLDPINLPFRADPFEADGRYSTLGVLFDAAPDAWGRTVMASDAHVSPAALSESDVLLKGKGSGVGAIVFSPHSTASPTLHPPSQTLPTLADIPDLYRVSTQIEAGVGVDEQLRAMLMSSWDMGGARPKAVVADRDGVEWIVKFPRAHDTYSRQRVEWANLEMARAVGIRTPTLQLIDLPDSGGDCALLVQRFDRHHTASGETARQHYISAVSLISPPSAFARGQVKRQMDTPYGAAYFSYARIAAVIRRISCDVTADLQELYARMILNILVHNVDDHLKNTGFLMQDDQPGFVYRLAPVFDVVTQENTMRHMLHVGPGIDNPSPASNGRLGSLANARLGARSWGLKEKAADAIIQAVHNVVQNRRSYYQRAGMTEDEIASVERWISPDASPPDGRTG